MAFANDLWTDKQDAIIHNDSGFIFPKTSGEFKFIKVSDKSNPHSPKASGISYQIPEKGIRMLLVLTPNLGTPEQNAAKLYNGSISAFKSLGQGKIKIQELSPPPRYGKKEDRYASWIVMENSPNRGTFTYVFSDRNYLISMTTIHSLKTDLKWTVLSMDAFLKNLNWSNTNKM